MQHVLHQHPHPPKKWKDLEMSEITELYISMGLKSLALSLVGIFVPIYMWDLGYSLMDILQFFLLTSIIRTVLFSVFGLLTAMRGPKHVIRYSYVLIMLLLIGFYTLPDYNWNLGWLALLEGASTAAFFTGYHYDFATNASLKKAGSQVSLMIIIAKIAAGAGPLIGGLVATIWGIEWTLILAIGILALAVIPLLASSEPSFERQKLTFKGMKIAKHRRNLLAQSGNGMDTVGALFVWPLFMAIFIFSDNVYASVGGVTTIGLAVSIGAGRYIGKVIDSKHGAFVVLRASAVLLALVHGARIFITSLGGVVLSAVTSELGVIGTRIAHTRGYYGVIESSGKHKLSTIVLYETVHSFARTLMHLAMILVLLFFSEKTTLQSGLAIAALGALLIGVGNWRSLRAK